MVPARCALLSLCLLGSPAGPVHAQTLETHGAWMLGCDNLRSCAVVSLEPAHEVTGTHLRIARSGLADAAPVLTLHAYDERRGARRIRIDVDGARLLDLDATSRDPLGHVETALPGASVLPALRGARAVTITVVQGEEAGPAVTIGGEGLAAALAAMDALQKRTGTVTALAVPGTRPATEVPPVPAPPRVRTVKAPPARVPTTMPAAIARAVADADCDEPPETRPIRAWLDERTLLWGVLCTRGAYRETYALFTHRTGERVARAADLARPSLGLVTERPNLLTGAAFDRRTGILSLDDLGRSLGDCGTSGRFAWDGQSFQVLGMAAMPDCRGVPHEGWLVTWRADTR
ncbi:DUF1176 domain-containing protein [Salinarimonas soli]|nr:DUF1176 domain-containing protein [Salinarimonas soli]